MIGGYRIEGHALVSLDDRIADAAGAMPASLHHPADWAQFQAALDAAAAVVLGRRSHEATPNSRGRNRIVVSSRAHGVERRDDAWWWNPAEAALADALTLAAPQGGRIVVPGGRDIFDLFLKEGYDTFVLARLVEVFLPAGLALFTACAAGMPSEAVLRQAGLVPEADEVHGANAELTITRWSRPGVR